ncbi:hypothetical protein H7I75_24555 [Mycobacterium stomatepiae]|nr:hypothetical protein [Mycobacterium stomatepiae]
MSRQPLTAVEICAGVRSQTLSATEVVESAIEASQLAQASTNCFVSLDERGARHVAARIDQVMKTPIPQSLPLAGVPYAYKDMFTRNGQPAGLGVSRSSLRTADDDTPCLDQLDSPGAITLGRLNLDPYGYLATGLNTHHGHVRNPFDPLRIAGGSSSGSAAVVASGAVPIAIGSDTGGLSQNSRCSVWRGRFQTHIWAHIAAGCNLVVSVPRHHRHHRSDGAGCSPRASGDGRARSGRPGIHQVPTNPAAGTSRCQLAQHKNRHRFCLPA